MKNTHSGIKIYRAAPEKRQKNHGIFPLFCLQMTVMCILMILWWNAVLSVFHMPFDHRWLYGGTCAVIFLLGWSDRKFRWKASAAGLAVAALILWFYRDTVFRLYEWMAQNASSVLSGQPEGKAAFSGIAVLASVPLLEILLAVQRKGRGKCWAGIVLAAPFFAAAAAGYFQPALPAWLLIAGMAVYFASAGLEAGRAVKGKRFFVWKHGALAVLFSAAIALISFQAGKLLDVQRSAENGYYLQTRSVIRAEVIGRVQDMLERSGREGQPEEERHTEEENTPVEQENRAEENVGDSYDFSITTRDSGMDDLGSLAYFQPESGQVSSIEVEEKPEGTVYVLQRWGVSYADNSWTEEDMTKSVLTSLEAYRDYPEELRDTLEMLCGGWNVNSFREVSLEISRELSERAVYNTDPGATPAGEDFVEYFLLENHKGFCVHFATAATLMYRYCGYTARYAEGYAVPASAFHRNNSGGYSAQITGSMGHAWCQVYEEQTGEWMDMEHTPPAPEGADIQPPASDSVREGTVRNEPEGANTWLRSLPVWTAAAAGVVILGFFVFFGQAAVRSAGRKRRLFGKDRGRGIREMYREIIKTAEFQGMEVKEPLAENMAERLGKMYPELGSEEWAWMYRCVMENMFYLQEREKEKWQNMKKLYIRFRRAAYSRMKPGEKWRFRYIRCQ